MRQIILAINALLKFKAYTLINVLGLACSLACVLTVARYIHQENTVNQCFPEYKRICLIKTSTSSGENFLGGYRSGLEKDPAVEQFTVIYQISDMPVLFGEQEIAANTFSVDSTFFKIFPYRVIAGSGRIVRPRDVVITRSFWKKKLGGKNAIGATFKNTKGNKFTIIGVVDDPDTKTSWMPDIFMSDELDEFLFFDPIYAMLMAPDTDIALLNKKYSKEHPRSKWSTYETVRYQYLPLKDLYYDKDHGKENKNYQYGNQSYVRVLMVVAFLVGIIGLLNFINIYTVIMSKRSREFGVKKVFGAGRTDIFLQIYAENILLTGLALLLCWALIEITRFFFFHELYIPTTTDSGFDRKVSAIVLLGLPLLTTVYPFLKYTCSRPVNSIRELASSRFSTRSRMILLCFQYVVTIFIITVSLFFVRQLEYMLCADLGFRSHDVITCRMYVDKLGLYKTTKEEGLDEGKRQYISNALVNKRMSESTLFEHWSRGNDLLFTDFRFDSFALNRAENGFHPALSAHLTTHSMAIYDFQLVEGRLWNDSIDEAFTKNSFKVIINETAKRVYGIKDITKDKLQPEEPHYASSSLPDFYNPPCEIVGVIKDFNVRHLSQSIQPVVIYYHDASIGGIYTVTASYKHENKAKVIDFLRRLYEESTGRTDFEYTLIEDELQKMYREDRQVVNIYTLFAGIAIFISSLGLLSISLFDIRQRYREIGLRKVNGAQTKDIYPLLIKKYLSVMGVATLLSIPLSWIAITLYLQDFAHKAPLTFDLFAVAVAITTAISLLTIIRQISKAANINPASIMKNE